MGIPKIDVVVTRHPGLVEFLLEEEIISSSVKVISHASPDAVAGKNVLGVLPHSLSVLTETFTEVPLNLPPELRGKELTVDQVREYSSEPVTYQIDEGWKTFEVFHGETTEFSHHNCGCEYQTDLEDDITMQVYCCDLHLH